MAWTKHERGAFSLLLLAMGEVYNESISPERIELFCRLLDDLPFEAVERAAEQHGRASKFFPRPAELREMVHGNPVDKAETAWTHLLHEVQRVGYMGKPSWPDELTEDAALGLFGSWRRLCENLPAGGPELVGIRKQFVALYGATMRKAQLGELGPSRAEASVLLSGLTQQLERRGLPTGKRARPVAARDVDAGIALRQVARLIVDQVQTCEEIEAVTRRHEEAARAAAGEHKDEKAG